MSLKSGILSTTEKRWTIAIVVGVLAAILLYAAIGWSIFLALIAGILICIILGYLLAMMVGQPSTPPVQSISDAEPAPRSAPAPTPVPTPAPAAAKATPTPAPAAASSGEGARPTALDGPRSGGSDDLKRIKGIGPKLEKQCNSLGFYHFDQIAAWSAAEVVWMDQNLEGFKGRVSRDTWVEQAGLLAAGGDTAFSKKVDKDIVY
ncbi:MAG: putative flap endonuclease-1-like 5' DNA nuclease [Paracoccaceae bacterium]|jgi:predicted flap endonuclease-1-like 5' DNA nuclease